jgi:ZIP family zinc transporter
MLEAALWGFLTSASLLLGAGAALGFAPSRRVVGLTLAFGGGALISAVAYDLVLEAFDVDALAPTIGLAAGALAFYFGDAAIDHLGGHGRKDMTGADQAEGDPLGIVLGACLDGIPESFILGLTLVEGGSISVAFVAAVFVSNLPEAIAATAGLAKNGWERRRIFGMWSLVVTASTISAALGFAVFDALPSLDGSAVLGFAAGAMLVMVSDTMMPQALQLGGRAAGLATTLGFVLVFFLEQVG